MKPKRGVHIDDHLVLPFGTATKADITRIHLVRVATDGIRLRSDVPVVHIDKRKKKPLTLKDFLEVFEGFEDDFLFDDERAGAEAICSELKKNNPNMTRYEELFLDYYFALVIDRHLGKYVRTAKEKNSLYSALLPIPEMQIYVADPLDDETGYEPSNNFRVDYGFWDGQQLIAVEIDGAEPAGYARDIRRDRMLRRAGIDVIHILNVEIEKHGEDAVGLLLPRSFLGNPYNAWSRPYGFDGDIPF
jgi:hypothetical protein